MAQFDAIRLLTTAGIVGAALLGYVMIAAAVEPSKVPLQAPFVKLQKATSAPVATLQIHRRH